MSTKDHERERRRRTLEELEDCRWGPPTYPSHVVTSCHRLREKPIGEFTVEELRLMIGQGIGLLLLPLAIEVLEREPLAEGDFFPGDLLLSVLRVDAAYWERNPGARRDLLAILERVGHVDSEGEPLVSDLDVALRAFRERSEGAG